MGTNWTKHLRPDSEELHDIALPVGTQLAGRPARGLVVEQYNRLGHVTPGLLFGLSVALLEHCQIPDTCMDDLLQGPLIAFIFGHQE